VSSLDEWMKELKAEMIPDGYNRQIAEEIGVENLLKLTQSFGGNTVYIPKTDSLVRPIRDIKIREEFNGHNYLQLSIKYNITERWVREICGEGYPEGQFSLFDYENWN
jgi:Mor family transcriptional regulator